MKKLLIVLFACSTIGLLYSMEEELYRLKAAPPQRGGLYRLKKAPEKKEMPYKKELIELYRQYPAQLFKDLADARDKVEELKKAKLPEAAIEVGPAARRLKALEAIDAELYPE
jgi:hypothetical protein